MNALTRYRLVYARLNQYSDEALVVGILYQDERGAHLKVAEQRRMHDTFLKLVDEHWLEQLFFSVRIQKEALHDCQSELSQITAVTSLLRFGKLSTASTNDSELFVNDLLKSSSVLYGNYRVLSVSEYSTMSQKEIEAEVKSAIIQINPFKGRTLVKSKTIRINKKGFEVPLFGERLIGAPISIQRVDPYDALRNAEHWMVRLKYAKRVLENEGLERMPHLYLLAPGGSDEKRRERVKNVSAEIEQFGSSVDVVVSLGETAFDIAESIYSYEESLT